MFLRQVTVSRDNYVLSPKFLENRLLNSLPIRPQSWNLFNTILRIFLHFLLVKMCLSLCWSKSYGHFTILHQVRIFVNGTETNHFATFCILSKSNHSQTLMRIECTFWVHFEFSSVVYIIIITNFYLRGFYTKIGHLR